jgi:superfamily I DNA/RNA helicase
MDVSEFKQTMAVLTFLANPHDDGALMDILESNLSMRKGIGPAVLNSLSAVQAAANKPEPLWVVIGTWLKERSLKTRTHNSLQALWDWFVRCDHRSLFSPALCPSVAGSSHCN